MLVTRSYSGTSCGWMVSRRTKKTKRFVEVAARIQRPNWSNFQRNYYSAADIVLGCCIKNVNGKEKHLRLKEKISRVVFWRKAVFS